MTTPQTISQTKKVFILNPSSLQDRGRTDRRTGIRILKRSYKVAHNLRNLPNPIDAQTVIAHLTKLKYSTARSFSVESCWRYLSSGWSRCRSHSHWGRLSTQSIRLGRGSRYMDTRELWLEIKLEINGEILRDFSLKDRGYGIVLFLT